MKKNLFFIRLNHNECVEYVGTIHLSHLAGNERSR